MICEPQVRSSSVIIPFLFEVICLLASTFSNITVCFCFDIISEDFGNENCEQESVEEFTHAPYSLLALYQLLKVVLIISIKGTR